MLTFDQFMLRADDALVAQLTSSDGETTDQARVEAALLDASSTIAGYTDQLSESQRPSQSVIEAHQISICLYNLAGSRAGEEFISLKNRYNSAIRFFERLIERAGREGQSQGGLDVAHSAPASLFDDDSLAAFGSEEVPK